MVLVDACIQLLDREDNNKLRYCVTDQMPWMDRITCNYGFIFTISKF